LSYLRPIPNGEFLHAKRYKHTGNDKYDPNYVVITYSNYATDDKGIAKGEQETNTQIASGIGAVKRTHKIKTTSQEEIKVNDRLIMEETGYTYRVVSLERIISSSYAQIYGITGDDQLLQRVLTLE